jgi:hypothetical protein
MGTRDVPMPFLFAEAGAPEPWPTRQLNPSRSGQGSFHAGLPTEEDAALWRASSYPSPVLLHYCHYCAWDGPAPCGAGNRSPMRGTLLYSHRITARRAEVRAGRGARREGGGCGASSTWTASAACAAGVAVYGGVQHGRLADAGLCQHADGRPRRAAGEALHDAGGNAYAASCLLVLAGTECA